MLDKDVLKVLKEDIEIEIYVAYDDAYSDRKVSQLEIDGKVYLDMVQSEEADYKNERETLICSYVFMGIGGALLLLCIPCFYKKNKAKRKMLELKSER